jgi:anti-anti-sigma regulatory factor
VPEDVAVVGFDDIVEAQYANPPLTTVRSPFDALGRAAAEQLLVEIHTGRSVPPQIISVPTTLWRRGSCGCTTLDDLLADDTGTRDSLARWQTALIQQLVRVIRDPLPLDPTVPPTQIWPGAGVLVAALDAALSGQSPALAGMERAWQEATGLTENVEALHAALVLLEDMAEQRLAAMPNAATRPSVVALLRRIRLEMIRARLAHEVAPKHLLSDQMHANYAVSMALIGSNEGTARSLDWLAHTPATWGCLGLWDAEPAAPPPLLTIAGSYQRGAPPPSMIGERLHISRFPPIDQLQAAITQRQDLVMVFPIRTQIHDWGVLALSGWSAQALTTGAGNLTIQAALLGTTLDRNVVLSTLTAQQATLQAAYTRERMLSQTIRELGCPIIPLFPGVLLVPLIGAIDSQRAEQILSVVLTAISTQRAQTVLLDVTGVPVVDTQVANSLLQMARSAMLLGARVVMVGIRPEIAQSIVGLGIDLQHLTIEATLASALRMLQIRRPA